MCLYIADFVSCVWFYLVVIHTHILYHLFILDSCLTVFNKTITDESKSSLNCSSSEGKGDGGGESDTLSGELGGVTYCLR